MIAHSDNGPGFDPDDPLTVLLRPTPEYAGPPEGRYRSIRRRAARRRLLRTAAGIGVSCAVAAIVVLPLHLRSQAPASPMPPLAPPAASNAPPARTAPPSPAPATPRRSATATGAPTPAPSTTPASRPVTRSTAPPVTGRPTPARIRR